MKRFLTFCVLGTSLVAHAQYPDFATQEIYPITYWNGKDSIREQVIVWQNSQQQGSYLYLPNSPHLFEYTIGNRQEPEFSLIKYTLRSQADIGAIKQGGYLQFTVSNGLHPALVGSLEKAIEAKKGLSEVSLAPVQCLDATSTIYVPTINSADTVFRSISTNLERNFPLFGTQKIGYNLALGREQIEVLFPIIQTQKYGGILVTSNYNIKGYVRASIRITGQFTSLVNYMKNNKKQGCEISICGIAGIGQESSLTSIVQDMINNNVIKVEIRDSEGNPVTQLTTYAQTIVTMLVQTYMTNTFKLPDFSGTTGGTDLVSKLKDLANEASTGDAKFRAVFGSDEFTFRSNSTNTVDITYNIDNLLSRNIYCDGFLNLTNYAADVVNNRLLEIQEAQFNHTQFLDVPADPDSALFAQYKINRYTFDIALRNKVTGRIIQPLKVFYRTDQFNDYKWRVMNADGSVVQAKPLLPFVREAGTTADNYEYVINPTIVTRGGVVYTLGERQVTTTPIGETGELMNLTTAIPNYLNLTFGEEVPGANNPINDVQKFSITQFRNGQKSLLTAQNSGALANIRPVAAAETALSFILFDPQAPLQITMSVTMKNGTVKRWKYNGIDLRSIADLGNTNVLAIRPNDFQ